MGLVFGLRSFLKPMLVGLFLLASFSGAFVLAYIFTDYKIYLTAHKNTQAIEIESIKSKTEATLSNLKKALQLTEVRIQAAQGDPKRLQGILSSLHHSSPLQNLPEFHKVSYTKISPPRLVVTRLGVIPFETNEALIQEASSRNGGAFFVVDDKGVTGKVAILDPSSTLEGILEIQIDPTTLHNFLGTYETVDLVSKAENLTPKDPIPIYGKVPESFQTYQIDKKPRYAIFGLFTLFMAILIVLYLNFTVLSLQTKYQQRLEDLDKDLAQERDEKKSLRDELLQHQQDAKIHQISCQSQKKLQANLGSRQREQAQRIADSIDTVYQSFTSDSLHLSDEEVVDLLQISSKDATAMGDGHWAVSSEEEEEVDLKALIENIQHLFAEKIYKSNIMIETDYSSEIATFMGDPLLTENLLLNVIGKPIYRVPQNGTVYISLKESQGILMLEVRDNGFAGTQATEKLIKKSFDLFIDDGTFHDICLENGFVYKRSKADNGQNITHLIIPPHQEEVSNNSNVVKLFK